MPHLKLFQRGLVELIWFKSHPVKVISNIPFEVALFEVNQLSQLGGKEGKRDQAHLTNILRAAFTRADPKSAKKDSQLKQLFALWVSVIIKAARKHVDEIDPRPIYQTQKSLFLFYLSSRGR